MLDGKGLFARIDVARLPRRSEPLRLKAVPFARLGVELLLRHGRGFLCGEGRISTSDSGWRWQDGAGRTWKDGWAANPSKPGGGPEKPGGGAVFPAGFDIVEATKGEGTRGGRELTLGEGQSELLLDLLPIDSAFLLRGLFSLRLKPFCSVVTPTEQIEGTSVDDEAIRSFLALKASGEGLMRR
mgnify:CR=1 FL=1